MGGLYRGVGQRGGFFLGKGRPHRFGWRLESLVGFIHHHIADQADQRLVVDAHGHEGFIQGGFDHVANLALGLGHENLQGQPGNRVAALLLKQQVAHLGTVAVGDNDSVVLGEQCDLSHRDFQVVELLVHGAGLPFLDQGISTQGDQQHRLWLRFLLHQAFPQIFRRMAFWACMRFSASSKTIDVLDSSTASVVSTPRSAGRQCMNRLALPVAVISSSLTWNP